MQNACSALWCTLILGWSSDSGYPTGELTQTGWDRTVAEMRALYARSGCTYDLHVGRISLGTYRTATAGPVLEIHHTSTIILIMPLEAAGTLFVGKALEFLTDVRKEAKATKVTVEDSGHRSALLQHLRELKSWSETIVLLALNRQRDLADSFAELSFATGFNRQGAVPGRSATLTIGDVYRLSSHAAVLGGPGAGKTTSLQRIAQFAYGEWEQGTGGVPLLVRFRDLKEQESLISHLLAVLAIYVDTPGGMTPDHAYRWKLRTLMGVLERFSAILLLDGLDELHPNARSSVEKEMRDIAAGTSEVRLFVTCRLTEYRMPFAGVQAYTIAPLTAEQIASFAVRWLGKDHAPGFSGAVAAAPYAGTEVVPLMLAQLCALYENAGTLPERPIEIYEQMLSLLVEAWDLERGVVRHSKYADFHPRKKESFLKAVAYELTQKGRRGTFHDSDLIAVYKLVAHKFDLPRESAREVVDEIESHTGLVSRRGNSQFDFFHITIQEYLSAMHAHRLSDATPVLYPNCPNELALVVADSHDVTEYLQRLLNVLLTSGGPPTTRDAFMNVFLARLLAEHPPFRASAELGWTVLALLSATLHKEQSGGWDSASIRSGIALHPKVRNSIEMGMHPLYDPPDENLGISHHSIRRVSVLDHRIDKRQIEFLLQFLGFKAFGTAEQLGDGSALPPV